MDARQRAVNAYQSYLVFAARYDAKPTMDNWRLLLAFHDLVLHLEGLTGVKRKK